MELKVYKDTVTAAESICDTKLELPVETEMLIPDYLPQVFKIVKCFVYLVVLQKQVTAGRLTVDGYLRCVVYYQSEGDESLCQAEQKLPFTKQVDVKPGSWGPATVLVSGETEYVNCRAVNQRRVDVRGAVRSVHRGCGRGTGGGHYRAGRRRHPAAHNVAHGQQDGGIAGKTYHG